MSRRVAMAVASCAAGLVLAACGTTTGGPTGAPTGTGATTGAPTTTTGTASPPGSTVPSAPPNPQTTLPTAPPTKGARSVVVRGVVRKGVEAGCWVLTPDTAGERYVLTTPQDPPVGVPVTVYGTVRQGTVSYCMQGTPLAVTKIERR